jgi:hypothetical protein
LIDAWPDDRVTTEGRMREEGNEASPRRSLQEGDDSDANKVRLGIVGLGAQGSMYARFIKTGMVPNMEIGAIC